MYEDELIGIIGTFVTMPQVHLAIADNVPLSTEFVEVKNGRSTIFTFKTSS